MPLNKKKAQALQVSLLNHQFSITADDGRKVKVIAELKIFGKPNQSFGRREKILMKE